MSTKVNVTSMLLAVALTALASSCSTVSVKTDSDPRARFGNYRTFKFVGGTTTSGQSGASTNTLVADRIKNAVISQLRKKGMQANEESPDLVVAYVAGAKTKTEIESAGPHGHGYGPYMGGGWYGPGHNDWWVNTYTEGTLIIDLIDTQTKKLVWRAYCVADTETPGAKETIDEAVAKAFAEYPPKN